MSNKRNDQSNIIQDRIRELSRERKIRARFVESFRDAVKDLSSVTRSPEELMRRVDGKLKNVAQAFHKQLNEIGDTKMIISHERDVLAALRKRVDGLQCRLLEADRDKADVLRRTSEIFEERLRKVKSSRDALQDKLSRMIEENVELSSEREHQETENEELLVQAAEDKIKSLELLEMTMLKERTRMLERQKRQFYAHKSDAIARLQTQHSNAIAKKDEQIAQKDQQIRILGNLLRNRNRSLDRLATFVIRRRTRLWTRSFRARMRSNLCIVLEIFTKEIAHVRKLTFVQTSYLDIMRKRTAQKDDGQLIVSRLSATSEDDESDAATTKTKETDDVMMSKSDMKYVFGNLPELLSVHTKFRDELYDIFHKKGILPAPKGDVTAWNKLTTIIDTFKRTHDADPKHTAFAFNLPTYQLATRDDGRIEDVVDTTKFGFDVVISVASRLKRFAQRLCMPAGRFAKTWVIGETLVRQRQREQPSLKSFCDNNTFEFLPIDSVLGSVAQKPLRYGMFLSDLSKPKHMPSNPQRQNALSRLLDEAQKECERVVKECDEQVGIGRLEAIQHRFADTLDLVHDHRTYIADARMEKGSHNHHRNPRHIYLFNDVLIYTSVEGHEETVKGVLYLRRMSVTEQKSGDKITIVMDTFDKAWDLVPSGLSDANLADEVSKWRTMISDTIKRTKAEARQEIECVRDPNERDGGEPPHIKVYGSEYYRNEYGICDKSRRVIYEKRAQEPVKRRSTFFNSLMSPFHADSHTNEYRFKPPPRRHSAHSNAPGGVLNGTKVSTRKTRPPGLPPRPPSTDRPS